jgi:hypothetical protein
VQYNERISNAFKKWHERLETNPLMYLRGFVLVLIVCVAAQLLLNGMKKCLVHADGKHKCNVFDSVCELLIIFVPALVR